MKVNWLRVFTYFVVIIVSYHFGQSSGIEIGIETGRNQQAEEIIASVEENLGKVYALKATQEDQKIRYFMFKEVTDALNKEEIK